MHCVANKIVAGVCPRLSVSEPPPNCQSFYDDLYQTRLWGCSAFPESRLQSLPHPYSPLRANTFLRISRNRVQASKPHLNKIFGMRVLYPLGHVLQESIT